MSSPTQRTLQKLRKEGYHAQVVEKVIPRGFTKIDLFGAIDIVAVRPDVPGVLGIQCTSASNQSARFTKASLIPAIRAWVCAGNRMEIWGWSKKGPRGKRKLWTPTIKPLVRADFPFEDFPSVSQLQAAKDMRTLSPGDAGQEAQLPPTT